MRIVREGVMPNYLIDVHCSASFRVDAESEDEAKEKLAEALDCCEVTITVDGEPVGGELSLAEGDAMGVVECDGEPV